MTSRAPAVVFDFEGSLEAARRSWAIAAQLRLAAERRRSAGSAALARWSGRFATEFAGRLDAELQAAAALAGELEHESRAWAEEWRKAIDQENWNRYQAACDRVRSRRSALDRLGGALFGHDDLPPTPSPASTPIAPSFAATRRFRDYSGY